MTEETFRRWRPAVQRAAWPPTSWQSHLSSPNALRAFFSTKANGRGIGLTLAREILEQRGFGFSLESPAGGPTRFTIRF